VEIWNQMIAIAVVLGALAGALAWARRVGWTTAPTGGTHTRNRQKCMRVIERISVTAQHSILLIEIDRKRLLVCFSPGGSSVTKVEEERPCASSHS
jgi:flagellar biogenesis protein FliO